MQTRITATTTAPSPTLDPDLKSSRDVAAGLRNTCRPERKDLNCKAEAFDVYPFSSPLARATAGVKNQMDLFAPWHLLLVLLIVLVVFGPRKLGDLGGALGKAFRDFRKAVNGSADSSDPRQKDRGTSVSSSPSDDKSVKPS